MCLLRRGGGDFRCPVGTSSKGVTPVSNCTDRLLLFPRDIFCGSGGGGGESSSLLKLEVTLMQDPSLPLTTAAVLKLSLFEVLKLSSSSSSTSGSKEANCGSGMMIFLAGEDGLKSDANIEDFDFLSGGR